MRQDDAPFYRVGPVVGPVRQKPQPFAKPSGKRTPKVNDDDAGWRKEHENELA